MKNKNLLIPPAIVVNFILFSVITELIRQSSDVAVFVGIILLIAAGYGNYFLIKYITKNKQAK